MNIKKQQTRKNCETQGKIGDSWSSVGTGMMMTTMKIVMMVRRRRRRRRRRKLTIFCGDKQFNLSRSCNWPHL